MRFEFIAVMALMVVGQSNAQTLNFLSENRSVSGDVSGSVAGTSFSTNTAAAMGPTAPFDDFHANLGVGFSWPAFTYSSGNYTEADTGAPTCAKATQDSTITPSSITAVMSVTGHPGGNDGQGGVYNLNGQANAHSSLEIVFTVLSPLQYDLVGSVSALGPNSYQLTSARHGSIFQPVQVGSIHYSGILAPDTYTLEERIDWFGAGANQGGQSMQMNFTISGVSAVPEPSSGLLLGAGLAGFAALRRWKRW